MIGKMKGLALTQTIFIIIAAVLIGYKFGVIIGVATFLLAWAIMPAPFVMKVRKK